MVSSTNGLADNPNRDYSSLFEVNDDNKGIFSILESKWENNRTFIEIGGWFHSGKHQALNDSRQHNLKNYGAYLTAGTGYGDQSFELRTGYANEKVSIATAFASLANELSFRRCALGSAYAYTQTSKYLSPTHGGIQEVEMYAKRMIGRKFSITPLVQYFKNPLYDKTVLPTIANELWTANVRFNIVF